MRQHKPRDAYAEVADEFGVSERDVRELCGPIGKPTGVAYAERLDLLRAKMVQVGIVPPTRNQDQRKHDESDELPELRSCVLCEDFLEDDDHGVPLTHAETRERGLLCRRCAELR